MAHGRISALPWFSKQACATGSNEIRVEARVVVRDAEIDAVEHSVAKRARSLPNKHSGKLRFASARE